MDILNEKIEGLVKKAEKSGMPYSILKKVYDRGMAAWKTGHRPGTTPQQWAFARVNSFVTKSSGTWGKADKDLADKVRGAKKEEIENPKKAKDIVGQVKEKLGKDADAGDYVKDFKKSDAPQFKGKSDKKIQKMAIAAYLDSKEEVKEENCPKCDNDPCKCENIQEQIKTFNRNALTPLEKSELAKHFDKLANDRTTTRNEKPYYQTLSRYVMGNIKPFEFNDMIGGAPEQVLGSVSRNVMKIIGKAKAKKFIPGFKEENIQESGHTDVASMKTQVQIAMDALQKMNMELGKLGNEDDLPTWWTNKVATAVNKLDGMADYIDAIHDKGETMSEEVNLEEGRMKELAGYIARGMSAQAIAKKMKIDVKTIEKLMKEDLDEGKFTLPTTHVIVDKRTNKVTHASSDEKSLRLDVGRKSHLKIVKLKKPVSQKKTGYLLGEPLKAWGEEVELDESKDVRKKYKGKEQKSVDKLIMQKGVDKVQKFHDKNPREFDNMVKKLAMLEEVELDEQKVFVFRYEYKGKRYAAPFGSEKDAKEAMKAAMKDRNVKDTSITQDILKRGVKFVEDVEIDDIEEVAQNDAFVVTGGPGDNAQKVIAVFKDKGNGLKDAKKARDDYNKKNRPTKATHKARIYRQSRLSQSRNKFKPGEQIKYSTYGNKQQFTKLKEDIDEAVLAGRDYNYDGKGPIKISKKMYAKVQRDSKSMIKGKPYMMALNPKTQGTELVPVVFEEVDNLVELKYGEITIDTRNSNISKQLFHYLRYDIMNDPKISNSIPYDIDLQVDNDSDRDTFFRMYPDMEQRDIKKVVAHLKKKYGSSIKIQLEGVEQEEWMVDENSLAAQATRVISQTAIREKKDPADIDMTATDLDRKAADKNIFVQLKRAQDMKGKGDIEFLDKKKKKVDIRIINKAIDMMMKMKPADRAKMQTAIGKSYRDLLKTVQRGKV